MLGLGCRFEEMETNWKPGFVPAPEACYIQVDVDAAEIGRSVPARIGLVGDVRAVLEQLAGALRETGMSPDGFADHPRVRAVAEEMARIEADVTALADSDQRPIHPLRVIRAAREAFPRETTVAVDVGCLAQHMAGGTPMFTWCVLNDGALGSIWDIQQYLFEERILGTEFDVQPDFAEIARACGCHGERCEDPDGVAAALAGALAANERGVPAVLDFQVARARMLPSLEHSGFYPEEVVERARHPAGALR